MEQRSNNIIRSLPRGRVGYQSVLFISIVLFTIVINANATVRHNEVFSLEKSAFRKGGVNFGSISANLGKRVKRQAVAEEGGAATDAPAPASTDAPAPAATDAPAPAATDAPAPAATDAPAPAATDAPAPAATDAPEPAATEAPSPTGSQVNITGIDYKNYTFVDHTTFNHTMNRWDFDGVWNKVDLSLVADNIIPLPRPGAPSVRMEDVATGGTENVEGGGTVGDAAGGPPDKDVSGRVEGGGDLGSAAGGVSEGEGDSTANNANADRVNLTAGVVQTGAPDENNFVLINHVSPRTGMLSRKYEALTIGEVIISYIIIVQEVTFKISIIDIYGESHLLFRSTDATDDVLKQWTTRAFKFTEDDTKNQKFSIKIEILTYGKDADLEDRVWAFAVHHISVGGMVDPNGIPVTPIPGGIEAPLQGSIAEISLLASRIWTALYVFLAMFLLTIAAVVALVARGRCR